MYKSHSIHDLIILNDKKFRLTNFRKAFQSERLRKFKNKPAEINYSVMDELILNSLWINIEYSDLNHFFYKYAGEKYDLQNNSLEYYKNKSTLYCSLDKKYIISELIYQYDSIFENSKKLRRVLLKLINNKFDFSISSESDFDLILKLIARYLLLEIKFNKKKFDISSIFVWFKNIEVYLISEKGYSKFLKFLKYSFNNFSHKGLREFLLCEVEKLESIIVKYVDKSSFNVIENIYFDLAEVYRLFPNEEKSQIYFKKEIDLILSYCNMFPTKDMSLSIFITKAIEISKNKTINGSYKLEELKKLFSQFSLDVNKNLKKMPVEKEIEELYMDYYNHIKSKFNTIESTNDVLTYVFLNFTHFSFLQKDILKEIKKKKKESSFPIRFLATKIHTSHYGRASIDNGNVISNESIDKFY